MMRIAIISLYRRLGDKTGDMVQAEKTLAAMQELGCDVSRFYFKEETGEIYDAAGVLLGAWDAVLADCDIVHAIPPVPWKFVARQKPIRAKFVCSTVFWRSYCYTRVLQKVCGHLSPWMVKDYVRILLARFGIPSYRSYFGYDLLLPNSEDEIRNVRRYCHIKRDAIITAVPNAIDSLPDYVESLERTSIVPAEDYILVPGVFAPRKNQLTFIHALRESSHPIVFIGDGECLDSCRRVASPNMRFLGHIPHGSLDFYRIMKYARVVCLPSNCETPGIAGLEAAALGVRPVVPYEGGTCQYYGWDAEYVNPLSEHQMAQAIDRAWARGRLDEDAIRRFRALTWDKCAKMTVRAYQTVLGD